MNDLTDYVEFIARSMEVNLTNQQKHKIAMWIAGNEKYAEFMNELEELIINEGKNKDNVLFLKR